MIMIMGYGSDIATATTKVLNTHVCVPPRNEALREASILAHFFKI